MADTDSVYRTMQHILESYDGITSADIDYNNMAGNRGRTHWRVGRQIQERKKSSEYLDELAKHSFVSIYPTRAGKRGIKAWREDTTVIDTHDDAKILKDRNGRPMITKYEKVPISKVYNDIKLNYDWNPGFEKFNKTIHITNTDQSSFPSLLETTGTDTTIPVGTGDDTFIEIGVRVNPSRNLAQVQTDTEPAWAEIGGYFSYDDGAGYIIQNCKIDYIESSGGDWYVGGTFVNTFGVTNDDKTTGNVYSNGTGVLKWTTYVNGAADYTSAKAWWDACHAAYQETKIINQLKYDCYWYYDNTNFGESGGTNDTAYYLLQNIIDYCTKQKYIVEYHLPINAANLQLEINDPIYFNDVQYTNSTDRLGYIKSIKIIPTKSRPSIMIQLILDPFTLTSTNLIIETGSAPDTITESGSQTDTITEGAQ